MSASSSRLFVIVAAARTGSTMLATMLNAHPAIVCGGEVLNDVWIDTGGRIDWAHKSRFAAELEHDESVQRLRREDPIAFLGRLRELAEQEGFAVIGFKLLYAHGSLRPEVVEYLAALPDFRVIDLRRRSRLRRLISLERAKQSGEWVATRRPAGGESRPPLQLAWEDVVRDFETTRREERAVERTFARCPSLRLDYEDLLADRASCADAVQRFLGVEPRALPPSTLRQGGELPERSIANYAELAERARGSDWEAEFSSDSPR